MKGLVDIFNKIETKTKEKNKKKEKPSEIEKNIWEYIFYLNKSI